MPRPTVVFRPTVVIGLGGTGYGAVLKLKKRFVETYGYVPPIIQLLSIDTTENAQRREESSEGLSVSLDPSEMYQISITNPGQIVKLNKHIQDWWPPEVNANLPIDKGAGQVRARGRLGLFARSGEISDRIHQAINRVRDLKNNKQADADNLLVSNTGGVEVYIVGSLAGGTGSGTFLDIAFMTRNRDEFLNIIGVLALPRVFLGKPFTDLVQSNTYGALKEIEHFWQPEPFELNYGNTKVEVTRSPFDLLFLIDSWNELGRVVGDPNDLQSLIADGLYVQIGSQIGVDSNNAADNIKAMLSEKLVKKRRVSYCSFGFASLTLPVQQYEKMQLEDACKLINNDILGAYFTDKNLEVEVDSFIQERKLDEATLIDALTEKESGGQMRFQMSLTGMRFDRGAEKTIKDMHTRFYSSVEQQVVQQIFTNYAQIEATVLQSIDDWWEKIINRANGIDYATKFLQILAAKLAESQQKIQKKSQEAQRQSKAIRFEDREEKIAEASKVFLGRERKIEAACQNYAGLVNQQCQMYLHLRRCDKAAELLSVVRSRIDQLLQQQEQIINNLNKSLVELEREITIISSKVKSNNPFEHTIQRFDVEANRPKVSHDDLMRWRREKNRLVIDWAEMKSKEVETEIREFISECYRPLTEMSIDEVLQNSDPEAVSQDLNQLWNLAFPLWRYDESKIPLEEKGIINESYYYGTQDANNTALKHPSLSARLPKGRTEPSFVTTSDPHRITLFRVKVGVPLFALYGIEDMELAYKNPGKAFKHLHKDWVALPNVIPPEYDDGVLLWFALGLALKIIVKKAGYYCMESQKAGINSRPEIRLGQERIEAFQELRSKKNRELVQELIDKIEQQLDYIRQAEDETKVMVVLGSYTEQLANQLATNKGIKPEVKQQVEAEISVIQEYIERLDPNRLD